MPLTVLEPGLFTTVQDRPRTGRRGLGVPAGGPADAFSLAIANFLVGNPADTPGLEMTNLGPTLRAEVDLACAVFGAPFEMWLTGGTPFEAGGSFRLRAGEVLRIRGCRRGMRAYLAVAGGLAVAPVLGCASAEIPLAAGTTLPTAGRGPAGRTVVRRPVAEFEWNREPLLLRVLPGDHLDPFDADALFGRAWRVGPECDRMGIRLTGPPLTRPTVELLSEPICPGTVQITNEGLPVVLGPACQTIGGYPRAAHVVAADLDKLGQLRPGDEIRLDPVGREHAEQMRRGKAVEAEVWRRRLHAAVR
jgi:antagonist of KipI